MKLIWHIGMVGLAGWFIQAQRLAAACGDCSSASIVLTQPQTLVITEVMSQSSPTKDGVIITQTPLPGPDWFELTNYGTNDLDLTGYSISDRKIEQKYPDPFVGLTINAGETLIFFRSRPLQGYTNTANFVAWWWGDCRPAPPGIEDRIHTYDFPGLSGDYLGDELWLFDPNDQVVDRAAFGAARPGIAFGNCPGTGIFGCFSQPDVDEAFQACTADDIGSPGYAPPSIPLGLIVHPTSETACEGATVTLVARAIGLPRPTYRWFKNGIPLEESAHLVGTTSDVLVILDFGVGDVGDYWAVADNALQSLTSEVATVAIAFDAQPPDVLGPCDLEVFPDQSAIFRVAVRGCPPPRLQWFTNGVPVPGATDPVWRILPTELPLAFPPIVWNVAVTASNAFGKVTNQASLTIVERPQLLITEVMPWEYATTPPGRHGVWFELTNLGEHPVRLRGYRFLDYPDWCSAFELTNDVALGPRESMVFVSEMTPGEFRAWWDNTDRPSTLQFSNRLPPRLQIITFYGFGFRAGYNAGEPICVWNQGAADDFDMVTSTSYVTTVPGVSLLPDEDGWLAIDSRLGTNGAIQAVEGGEIGSPGFYRAPRILSCRPGPTEVELRWWAEEGRRYQVRFADQLGESPDWVIPWAEHPDTVLATESVATVQVPLGAGIRHRFYQVKELP